MEGLPSGASRRISGQFSNPTKQLGWIVISNGQSNGPCSWARHSRRSAAPPRMSLFVTRPMRKTEIFTVLRVGLASPIARYSSGARIAGQRATQNEQYKNTSYLILRDRRSIWRDDSTTRMTRVLWQALHAHRPLQAAAIENDSAAA